MNIQVSIILLIFSLFSNVLSGQNNPPILNNFTVSESCIDVSNNTTNVTYSANITESEGEIALVVLIYSAPNESSGAYELTSTSSGGDYEITVSYGNSFIQGEYHFGLIAVDYFNNFFNYNLYNRDLFSAGFQDSLKLINDFSESIPPSLNDFIISHPCINTSYGTEDVKFTTDLSDNISGISYVYLNYLKPDGTYNGVTMDLISGDSLNGTYEVIISFDNTSQDGLYLYGLSAYDNFNNILYFDSNDRNLSFNGYQDSLKVINTNTDFTAPILNNFTISELSINVVNNTEDVTFTAHINDNMSGVSQVILSYLEPNGNNNNISMNLISGDALNGFYEAIFTYDSTYLEGLYIYSLTATDISGNILHYDINNRELSSNSLLQDSLIILNCPIGIESLNSLKISNYSNGIIHISEAQECYKTTVNNNGDLESNIVSCNIGAGDIFVECGTIYLNTITPKFILTSPNGQCWKVNVGDFDGLYTIATNCSSTSDIEIEDGDLYFEFRIADNNGPILKSLNSNCYQLININNQLEAVSIICP
jgi:hypothetical protein